MMHDGDFGTGSMMTIPPSAKLFTDTQLLRRNLRKFGWSPVLVDISILSNILHEEEDEEASSCHNHDSPPPPPPALALLRRHRDWETLHEIMFDHQQTTTSDRSVVTYRCAESGSPGGSLVEPKQSLELKRTNGTVATSDNDPVHVRMKSWITILHAVARTVAKTLEWPDDTLIASNKKNADTAVDQDDDTSPMDLLRAFLYDAVVVPNHHTKNDVSSSVDHDDDEVVVSLGSSPHTDWGSLTVVWQDGVGGLETFCRQHDRWVPVPAPVVRSDDDDDDDHHDKNFLPLIIHIGDVTSLAIGGNHDDDDDGRTTWPSPLHRVCSPTTGRRRSLVYFCYPSPKVGSLHNLQHLLRSTDFTDIGADAKVGLEHYSLLQNQSQDGQQQLSSPRQVYERILHQPLAEVFSNKWSQVQR